MKKRFLKITGCLPAGLCMLLFMYHPAAAKIDVKFLYPLANFSGPVKMIQGNLAVSRKTNETFLLDPRKKDIRVYNKLGMEIFRMGEENEFTTSIDFTVDDQSNIYALSSRYLQGYNIAKYNFRGDLLGKVKIKDIPPQFSDFRPSMIVWRRNLLYLAEPDTLQILVLNQDGKYKAGYSLLSEIQRELAQKSDDTHHKNSLLDMFGFTADDQGNMYFTLPVISSAFRLSPDNKLRSFGKGGSAIGQFGVVSGVAVDKDGYIYLTDKLRCVVIIFNKDFKFVKEFGYRGYGESNLIVPTDVAVSNGNIYIAQAGNRGVSVFKITKTPDLHKPPAKNTIQKISETLPQK